MNDLDLVTAFERGTITAFPHREHVRVAWILLERDGYDRGVAAMTGGIRRMAMAAGLLSKYHETRTIAWMRLINDARTEPFETSSDFVDHRPALLRPDRLDDHYSAGRLASDEARTSFVEADLTPLP